MKNIGINSHETVKSDALGDLGRPFPKNPDEVISTLVDWYLRKNEAQNEAGMIGRRFSVLIAVQQLKVTIQGRSFNSF